MGQLSEKRRAAQIAGGFGREYTYNSAYAFQGQFRAAQVAAQKAKSGLWGACPSFGAAASAPKASPTSTASSTSRPATPARPIAPSTAVKPAGACTIKGNISSTGEKIYHVPGGRSYDRTKITAGRGERYFCSGSDASAAGWRAAQD